MKTSIIASGLAFAHIIPVLGMRHVQWNPEKRTVQYSPVPEYNFTMPVDHLDSSNTATYSNRYFVNDTYYKAGGPVILYDFGENGVSDSHTALYLAEYGIQSAPMRLASQLGGLVIGWEHRYFGYSRPVPLNDTTGYPTSGDASSYKYLTVEQAIEDVVCFANNFNKTSLSLNKVVKDTANLDPYNTPWIFVGGSYPGARAALIRAKHPEVIYASWASSAPVEDQYDGSYYYNPIMRALPRNCSSDIKAAIKYIDDTWDGNSTAAIAQVQAITYVLAQSQSGGKINLNDASSFTPFQVGEAWAFAAKGNGLFQNFGVSHTMQVLCDYAESFDVKSFSANISTTSTESDVISALFSTPFDSIPTTDGIAAAYGTSGGQAAFLALSAAYYQASPAMARYTSSFKDLPSLLTPSIDGIGWNWLVLNEIGCFLGSNASNPIQVVSKYYNATSYLELALEQGTFKAYPQNTLPTDPGNNSYIVSSGGWNMQPSNVMFTNGEFDPWRGFTVASQETSAGAPTRAITQTIPACNQPPNGTDVFGLLYPGAVHEEDLTISRSNPTTFSSVAPMTSGLELFVNAYKTWQPCFNQSRDAIRNGNSTSNSTSGSGTGGTKGNDATRARSGISALTVVMGVASAMLALL